MTTTAQMQLQDLLALAEGMGLARKPVYSAREATRLTGLSYRRVLEEAHGGGLRTVRNGNRVLVPATAIIAFLNGKTPAERAGDA